MSSKRTWNVEASIYKAISKILSLLLAILIFAFLFYIDLITKFGSGVLPCVIKHFLSTDTL